MCCEACIAPLGQVKRRCLVIRATAAAAAGHTGAQVRTPSTLCAPVYTLRTLHTVRIRPHCMHPPHCANPSTLYAPIYTVHTRPYCALLSTLCPVNASVVDAICPYEVPSASS
eukprot:354528-Chlamydomonas_euryale.AAC.2